MSHPPETLTWLTQTRSSFLHSEDKSTVKSVLLRHGTYCTLYMRNAQDLLCLAYEQERKTTCMYMAWTATRGMHFSTPPSQPRQGVATYSLLCRSNPSGRRHTCPKLEKRGPEDTEKVRPVRVEIHPVLCCVWSAALLWHCWHTWYSTNLCEFANVGQVLVR